MEGDFHLPLDVTWTEAGEPKSARFELVSGDNSFRVECPVAPMNIQAPHIKRLPGRHKVRTP